MANSYMAESEAPRDFRVSSTESDGHYTKCVLCYTVKRFFYCQDCVKNGNFLHSSMPYSDRYSDKQAKLLRLKLNRKHVLDRCEKLLEAKLKKDNLLIDAKQARDKLDLLRLAIEQRRNNNEERRKRLTELTQHNNELKLKLPRYEKRVSSLAKHVQTQQIELQKKMSGYNDQGQSLAALRRSRIRQLTKYIFPVYMTYDTSDSIEDLEFLGDETEEEPVKQCRLHVVVPWVSADGDLSNIHNWAANKESMSCSPGSNPWHRSAAALGLAAQLLALVAHITDQPLHLHNTLSAESRGDSSVRARRVCAAAAALCARAALTHTYTHSYTHTHAHTQVRAPLTALHAICVAAACDDPMLGRVEGWLSESLLGSASEWLELAKCDVTDDDDEPPEHLTWPDTNEMEEISASPPAPAASLVTSLASMIRGWTK